LPGLLLAPALGLPGVVAPPLAGMATMRDAAVNTISSVD
jgi:hypothetical protein